MAKPDNKPKLTPKMEKFAEQFVICGGNAHKAAKASGYSCATALTIGTRNIRLPHVQEQIFEHIRARLGVLEELQEKFKL